VLKENRLSVKCKGQAPDGSQICSDRNRCGRFLRPDAPGQLFEEHYRAGDRCQHYEIVPSEHHIDEDPAEFMESDGWNDQRIEIIARNGNDGLHYGV